MWRKNYLKEVYFSILKINLFIFKISFNKHYKYLLCCCCCLVTKSWLTLAIPWTIALHAPLSMGFPRRRILEWVVISFSRGSSQPRDQICVSCIAGRFFISWATWEAHAQGQTLSQIHPLAPSTLCVHRVPRIVILLETRGSVCMCRNQALCRENNSLALTRSPWCLISWP